MVAEFKSSNYANSYVICRFHECVIINPSHSYEEISDYIGSRSIVGLFATEISKENIDQIAYYSAPLHLSTEQIEAINSDFILGYDYKKNYPFNLNKIKIIEYFNEQQFKIGGNNFQVLIIDGVQTPTTIFIYKDNLFVGNLFNNNKLAKKANYKSSIYDLKKSIVKLINLPDDYKLYHSYRESNKFSQEKNNNPDLNRWL